MDSESWLKELVPTLSEELRRKLVAHRGFHCTLLSDERPLECTRAALKAAWASGLQHCECDVRLSSDQKIILLHDPNLNRLVDGTTPDANTITAGELTAWPLRQPGVYVTLLEDALETALELGARLVSWLVAQNMELMPC